MMTDSIKTRIAEACKAARLTVDDLSGLTGIDAHQLINGDVTIQQADQISHATNTNYEWLVGALR